MLESAYAIKKYKSGVPNLSEQYWVSCDPGNKGCAGGNTILALWFARYSTGWWFEGEFPYTATDAPCQIGYPTRNLGLPKLRKEKPWERIASNPYAIKAAVAT